MKRYLAWLYRWQKVPLTFSKYDRIVTFIIIPVMIVVAFIALYFLLIGDDNKSIACSGVVLVLLFSHVTMAANNLAKQIKELKNVGK
jgi:hypothetical protein